MAGLRIRIFLSVGSRLNIQNPSKIDIFSSIFIFYRLKINNISKFFLTGLSLDNEGWTLLCRFRIWLCSFDLDPVLKISNPGQQTCFLIKGSKNGKYEGIIYDWFNNLLVLGWEKDIIFTWDCLARDCGISTEDFRLRTRAALSAPSFKAAFFFSMSTS